MLLAARGSAPYWDVRSGGRLRVRPDGSNKWLAEPGVESRAVNSHSYVVAAMPPAEVAAVIEGLMTHRPPSSD